MNEQLTISRHDLWSIGCLSSRYCRLRRHKIEFETYILTLNSFQINYPAMQHMKILPFLFEMFQNLKFGKLSTKKAKGPPRASGATPVSSPCYDSLHLLLGTAYLTGPARLCDSLQHCSMSKPAAQNFSWQWH